MTTDFNKIDFPENSISPTAKNKTDQGWELTWHYDDLISGIQIGMVMPQKVNPGPFVSRVTFFAPISLFLFFFLMFIITTLKDIKIHPMNYFFIAAAFFSFHLLLAYLADHIDIHVALMVSSVVSIFLVISYMRLVTGIRFALLETGISQFIYLVLFSYTFFLTGYTGLAITILCIVTLFIVMQITGRINWQKQFESTN
jgi:inner membrane protein involved in colicin E2 resistance